MKSGKSFSGRERHCTFLNLHDGRFADISVLSGLDFPDDGRGLALLDWNHDGRIDLCVANRNGPQVRLLRNEFAESGHFLALRLEGKTCNRDAIGARVEVLLEGDALPLVRTVRAGDAFLSQSSKGLHFGLGEKTAIASVTIRWPGGEAETVQGLAADGHYRVVQGVGKGEIWTPPGAGGSLARKSGGGPPSNRMIRVFTHAPIPVPRMQYVPTGATQPEAVEQGKPVLVNLWASWCAPCVAELREIAGRSEEIRRFGLDVLALSVDAEREGHAEAERRVLKQANWPFRSGRIDAQSIALYQHLNDFVLDLHEPLPLPVSFLLDGSGNLQGIFKGALEVDALLESTGRLVRLPPFGVGRAKGVLPFPGRWLEEPRRLNYIDLALALASSPDTSAAAALDYFTRHQADFLESPRAPRLLYGLGRKHEGEQRWPEAEQFYRRALARAANYIDALDGLAWLLASRQVEFPDGGPEAILLAEQAAKLTRSKNPRVMNTLAAAHARAGAHQLAIKHAEAALALAQGQNEIELAAAIEQHLEKYRKASGK